MDGDAWRNRVTAGPSATATPSTSSAAATTAGAKRQQAQPSPSQSDNLESDDDARAEYSCPYCYEDYEIGILCSHLEDEHCYESKVAVCPICAAKVLKDMAGHITVQHSQLFKVQRRRRFRRTGAVPSNATLSLLSKELREVHLQALLGPLPSPAGVATTSSSTTDSLISSLMCNPGDPTSKSGESSLQKSLDAAMSPEEREDRLKEAALRAKFVREVVISTLIGDN